MFEVVMGPDHVSSFLTDICENYLKFYCILQWRAAFLGNCLNLDAKLIVVISLSESGLKHIDKHVKHDKGAAKVSSNKPLVGCARQKASSNLDLFLLVCCGLDVHLDPKNPRMDIGRDIAFT